MAAGRVNVGRGVVGVVVDDSEMCWREEVEG